MPAQEPTPTPATIAGSPTPATVIGVPAPPKAPLTTVVPTTVSIEVSSSVEWGRVSEDGTVEVREESSWRVVGQYPDGTPDEALAYFVRKFEDLALKVRTLEQRQQSGGASALDLKKQSAALVKELTDAAAVGDLASLHGRLGALGESLDQASAQEAQLAKEAVDSAIASRTEIVEKAEALAASNLSKAQWTAVSAQMQSLFESWQHEQQNGPRLPKGPSQQLWKRFRDARAVVDRARRAFYAELDENHRVARDQKNRLIERAEALAARGTDGIPTYRTLLQEWKATGRAGRKADDALWARFKAAGDALYQARAEQSAAEEAESAPRITAREELLVQAGAVADEPNIKRARALLTKIQKEWDEVGRIFPRDRERVLDDRMRAIEQGLKSREEVDWKRNNPTTKARANDMNAQLIAAIEKLEQEHEAAVAKGDSKAAAQISESLAARKSWLSALGN